MNENRVRIVGMRKINPVKSIYFMNTADVTEEERAIALKTIEEILALGNARGKLKVEDFGVWRRRNYRYSNGSLVPHMSVDWYVNQWYDRNRNQVNLLNSMNQLRSDPWNFDFPHYDIILTALDLYEEGTRFLIGAAIPSRGTVTSVARFRQIKDKIMQRECKKQELYHEIGHVFGLPNEKRGINLVNSLGIHCSNRCAMRQGIRVPSDWEGFVTDRLNTGVIYCNDCLKELRKYFNAY